MLFKRNFLISLLLFVVAYGSFILYRELPWYRVSAPQYDMVYVRNYNSQLSNISIDGGHIRLTVFPNKVRRMSDRYSPTDHFTIPTVFYIYHASTGRTSYFILDLEKLESSEEAAKGIVYSIPELESIVLDQGKVAPDGYRLVLDIYTNRGFSLLPSPGFMFGHNIPYPPRCPPNTSCRNHPEKRQVLFKDGRYDTTDVSIPIGGRDSTYGENLFLGWVVR